MSQLRSHEKNRIAQALDLLGQAIERDPYYGPTLVSAARCHQDLHLNGRSEYEQASRDGLKLVGRALHAAEGEAAGPVFRPALERLALERPNTGHLVYASG